MKKLLWIIIPLALFPFAVRLIPEPMTIERVVAAYEDRGLTVENFTKAEAPSREAKDEWHFVVDGYRIEVHFYDSEGAVAKHHEYLKDDAGTVMVQSMGLAQQLGAAKPANLPSEVARRGKWIFYVQGESRDRARELVALFKDS